MDRDRGLGLFFVSMFLASWIAQLVVEWQVFADEQRQHDEKALFWSAHFWETFGESTLENWQSESSSSPPSRSRRRTWS